MRDNIMYYPSIVLMIAEALALGFLIYAWFRDKRRYKDMNKRCPCCGAEIVPYQQECLNCRVYLWEV